MLEYNAEGNENITRAIYRHEIEALGLEDSEVILPGMQVDAHVQIYSGELPKVTFRARVYAVVGRDNQGNAIPSVVDLKYYGQSWDTGGAYLEPTRKDPYEIM